MSDHGHHHITPTKDHMKVWAALLVFTFLTVASSFVDLKNMVVFAALTIATIKAVIVAVYFMHLKFDNKIFSAMLVLVMLVYLAFILITFIDYSYRP
jgi:cytochrome c oxidase subunit 4